MFLIHGYVHHNQSNEGGYLVRVNQLNVIKFKLSTYFNTFYKVGGSE